LKGYPVQEMNLVKKNKKIIIKPVIIKLKKSKTPLTKPEELERYLKEDEDRFLSR
jgi:hypothetical protein